MFVKVYTYHIQPAHEEDFLKVQAVAEAIYSKFTARRTIYLKSKEEQTKWMEMQFYKDEDTFIESIKILNEQEELKDLYKKFLSVLDAKKEAKEEDFERKLEWLTF